MGQRISAGWTPDQIERVRSQFVIEGISIAEWAKLRGYNPRTVYAVMQGTLACKRGISHQIAVDLGLKEVPRNGLLTHGYRKNEGR